VPVVAFDFTTAAAVPRASTLAVPPPASCSGGIRHQTADAACRRLRYPESVVQIVGTLKAERWTQGPSEMTLGHRHTGGSHAPTPSYPRPEPRSTPRRRAPAQTQFQDYSEGLGPGPLVAVAAAAARITSSSDACSASTGPLRETARKALMATLPDYPLARQLTARWPALPKALRRPPAAGHRPDADPLPRPTVRDPRGLPRPGQGGTSHFHAYATAYVVRHGQRYTVPDRREEGEPLKEVVQRLLRQAACVGSAPLLLLDRFFLVLQRGRGSLLQRAPV